MVSYHDNIYFITIHSHFLVDYDRYAEYMGLIYQRDWLQFYHLDIRVRIIIYIF